MRFKAYKWFLKAYGPERYNTYWRLELGRFTFQFRYEPRITFGLDMWYML